MQTRIELERIARAAALREAGDQLDALGALDELMTQDRSLEDHQPWWAVRAAVLSRLNDPRAGACYDRAIARSGDHATREFLAGERDHMTLSGGRSPAASATAATRDADECRDGGD
jgi:predicted RNA polymerase sigma factor